MISRIRLIRNIGWFDNAAGGAVIPLKRLAVIYAENGRSLDIFWLKDKSLTDLDNLPDTAALAPDIIENLESGLVSFRQVLTGLGKAV